jgi:hypothetical protein
MRGNNMKNPSRKRNEFEPPVQGDVKSVGMRVVTVARGMREKREGWREHAPSCGSCRSPSACMLVSE